jgi:ATP-dependent protease ClpP protease subunit
MKKALLTLGLIFVFCISITATGFSKPSKGNDILDLIPEPEPLLQQNIDVVLDKNGKIVGSVVTIDLYDEITSPGAYVSLINGLNKATKYDTYIFNICSPGGHFYTCLAIVSALQTTKAKTVANLQVGYSAAGIIAFNCKEIVVKKYASLMIHTLQLGRQGNLADLQTSLAHDEVLINEMLFDAFKNFLTPDEMKQVKAGQNLWFGERDIKRRIKK